MSNTPSSSVASSPVPSSTPVPVVVPPPLAARRVSIADRLSRAFPPLACVRGFRYFARRRVELSQVSEKQLDAEVKGKRTQHVRLRVEEGRVAAACTCAAKVLGPATCRHVWATLLEVDRQGVLASLRNTQRPLAIGVLDGPKPKRPKEPPAKEEPAVRTAKKAVVKETRPKRAAASRAPGGG